MPVLLAGFLRVQVCVCTISRNFEGVPVPTEILLIVQTYSSTLKNPAHRICNRK